MKIIGPATKCSVITLKIKHFLFLTWKIVSSSILAQDREEFSPRVADEEKANFVKPPEDSYQTGSVYSYSYRTAKQTRGEKAEQVYDVNYRIITPPAQDENQEREVNKGDEEDWI